MKFWFWSRTSCLCVKELNLLDHLPPAPISRSQKIYNIVDLIILVSFVVDQVYYLTSSVFSRLFIPFFRFFIYLLLNCMSRREIVVIGWKECDLSIQVQNSGLSPTSYVTRHVTFQFREFPTDKNEDVLEQRYLDVLSQGQKHPIVISFQQRSAQQCYCSHRLTCGCGQAEVGLDLWLGV